MSSDLTQTALSYLRDHHVMTVATNGPLGLWAAAVFYANEDFTLYFLSAPHTRHATNIHSQPRVAATIQENYADWEAIKGIQLEGEAALLEGEAQQHAIDVFTARFPLVGHAGGGSGDISRALDAVRWYSIRPDRLYFIDNSQGFGHRDEIPLPLP